MDAAHMILAGVVVILGWLLIRERRRRHEAQSIIAWRDELDRRRKRSRPIPVMPAWYDEED